MSLPAHIRLCLTALLAVFWSGFAVAQDDRGVRFEGTLPEWSEIATHLEFFEDSSREMSVRDVMGAPFQPLQREVADFGYTKNVIWLRFTLHNATTDENFVLAMRENFLQLYEVYIRSEDGAFEQIDSQDLTSGFAARRVLFPELTTPFVLPQNSSSDIYIRYWSGGSSEISWRVMTRDAFVQWSGSRTARNFVFYGMTLLFSMSAIVSWIVTRRMVFGAYAVYTLAGLLFIMHSDGNAFQYLWPNAPAFNAFATIPLGAGMITTGLFFSRSFLVTQVHNPIVDRVLIGMMAFTVSLALSSIVVDTQIIKRLLVLMSLIATVTIALAGFIAARTRFREVRFYLIAWIFAFIASAVMTLRHWLGFDFSEELQFNAMRTVLICDAALMGLAILDRINWLKQSQQAALEVSLAQANKTVELTTRLQDLEQKVAIADTLAVSQERNLTQTAHDIRQPLNALRLNLRQMTEDRTGSHKIAEVEETLGYLESLVSENLSNVLIADAPREEQTTEIGPIMASAVDMFAADATAKGIHLRFVESSARTSIAPLALMRMLTNLVSNAIKATSEGGILVGVRQAGGLRLEVHDTGSGLSAERFAKGVSGEADAASDGGGSGLGLGIVAQIADETGVRFERAETEARGTVLRLWLP